MRKTAKQSEGKQSKATSRAAVSGRFTVKKKETSSSKVGKTSKPSVKRVSAKAKAWAREARRDEKEGRTETFPD